MSKRALVLAALVLAAGAASALTFEEFCVLQCGVRTVEQAAALERRIGEIVPAVSEAKTNSIRASLLYMAGDYQGAYGFALTNRANLSVAARAAGKLGVGVGEVLAAYPGATNEALVLKWYGKESGDHGMTRRGLSMYFAFRPTWANGKACVDAGATNAMAVIDMAVPVRTAADAEAAAYVLDRVDRNSVGRERYASVLERLLIKTEVSDETAGFVGKVKSNLGAVK